MKTFPYTFLVRESADRPYYKVMHTGRSIESCIEEIISGLQNRGPGMRVVFCY